MDAGDTHSPLENDLEISGNNPAYANLSSDSSDRRQDDIDESAPVRIFDNPIYDTGEANNLNTNPDTVSRQAGDESESSNSPYREFDNPIYGNHGESVENVYTIFPSVNNDAACGFYGIDNSAQDQ